MNATLADRTLDRLIDLLDLVVREQVGESLANTMQRIRRLAVERRAGLPVRMQSHDSSMNSLI